MSTNACNTDNEAKPLQAALAAAISSHESAESAYDACECIALDGVRCVHYQAMVAADADIDAARSALAESDEGREWILREEGYDYDTVEADSAQDALEAARANVDRANYADAEGTLWVSVEVRCEVTDEAESATVQLDPDEPECDAGVGHDWQSPHELLGGLEENPGVQGHGGGVVVKEVCMRCGCSRTTDTWAQNPETGEQGLESVSYEQGEFAEAVARMSALIEVAEAGCERAQRAAAEVLAFCRGDHSLVAAHQKDRERVREVIEYLERVRRVAPFDFRALRLALRLAAADSDERRVAVVVAQRMA
jgi:hypothetical protein